jgi:hypothetical protein
MDKFFGNLFGRIVNFCMRGGAAYAHDAYAGFDLEVENKVTSGEVKLGIVSGASNGGKAAALYACGIFGKKSLRLHKALKFDRVMKWTGTLQDAKSSWWKKALLIVPTLALMKTVVSNSIILLFKANVSWRKAKYAEKVFMAVADFTDFKGAFGSKRHATFIDMFYTLKARGSEVIHRLAKDAHIYYPSNDGVWCYDMQYGYRKISDTIIPLHLAALATFVNPLIKDIVFDIVLLPEVRKQFSAEGVPSLRIDAFDGGVFDNWGGIPLWGMGITNYIQVTCKEEPKPESISSISDVFYLLHPAPRVYRFEPRNPDINFFGFDNAQLDAMYKDRQPTDIL